MNAIRGLSSLAPSFIPKFLSDYPRIHLFSKTNTSRFDISNSISVELTTTFKEGSQQVVLGNRDFPYFASGMRDLLRYYDVVFGNLFSKEPTEPCRKISYIILNAE